MWGTAALFVTLGALAVVVFFLLPGWVDQRPTAQPRAPVSTAPAPTAVPDLDAEGPTIEGPQSEDTNSLHKALAEGQRALESGDAATATAAFSRAATLDQGNASARRGLARAGVLDEVLALIRRGADLEQSGALEGAGAAYARAAGLDPQSEVASDGVKRVKARQTEIRFVDAMTEGLAALEAGNPSAAREAFERARSIRPSSPEVAEGIRRAEHLQRRRRIATLRDEAAAAETREDWRSAEKAYADVLAIDQHLAFAQEGLDRSAMRRDLADSIEFHLTHSERLVNDDVLAEAGAVLDRAREVQPTGPGLDDLIARLGELVEISSTPVTVSLHSDNLTEVVIYRVGRLGTFAHTTVQLRPGTYTVVGSRPGFRDVRLEVTVRPGGPLPPVIIRCEEEV